MKELSQALLGVIGSCFVIGILLTSVEQNNVGLMLESFVLAGLIYLAVKGLN